MITLREYMNVVDYRITEGSQYTWNSFGSSAYRLESYNEELNYSVSIVFDTSNQTVYEVEAHDMTHNHVYRFTNPLYVDGVRAEARERGVDYSIAYDSVKFIDLEVENDWIEKATAIVRGESYDTRVQIPMDFDKEELLKIMTAAHEQDITLNDYIERILRNYIVEYEVGGSKV